MENRSINVWDGSELELAWYSESSSYFDSNFPIFSLSVISNASTLKVRDVLHWVNLLVMETFASILPLPVPSVGAGNIWIYVISFLFSTISNKVYLP